MKIKLLIILLATQSLLTAQKARDIDLEVTFIKPDTNEIIYVPINYNLQFRVKNNGPDALKPGDILRYYTWNTDTGTRGVFKQTLTSTYLSGQSFTVNHSIPINSEFDADFYGISLSCLVYNLSADSIKSESDFGIINNRPVVIFRVRLNSNSTNPINQKNRSLFFHPNPAVDVLNLNQQFFSVIIYNTSGQKVLSIHQPGSKINISGLPQGLYFLEATLPDGINKKQGMFIKQ